MPSTEDYKTYSPTALIARIQHLESQISSTLSPSPCPPPKTYRKPRKPSKPFDPSRYHTRLIALKFAYLGSAYNGFEHHANNTTPLPTVEEELWRALRKVRLVFPDFGKRGNGGVVVDGEEEVCWEGTEYSKCGRTDRGVSAFGQVVGVRVRSGRPKRKEVVKDEVVEGEEVAAVEEEEKEWDDVKDELPYIQLLNRVLPPDIRVLAWCPHPGEDFSARFNCKERRYRYFFTNPAYATAPGTTNGEAQLNVGAMREAAKKYEGLHDFRNLCKVDPSKQITNFKRRVFHAGIHEARAEASSGSIAGPKLYYFEVRGSAFLWHQVRHLVAILFLVGQGYEKSSIVDELLDVEGTPNRPIYDMASDTPLVLWDCIFPDPAKVVSTDHGLSPEGQTFTGYEDALRWVYIGDEAGGVEPGKRITPDVDDAKYGRNGIMDELWALWRKRKMDEVLAGSLMEMVSRLGSVRSSNESCSAIPADNGHEPSDRIFDGSEKPRSVGTYIPLMQRTRLESPEVVNARYAARKGLNSASSDREEDVNG